MYLTQRMWHHVPAQFQRLSAFAIIAVLAFSVGWAAGAYGPAAYTFLTTDRNAAPVAAPPAGLRIPNSVAQAPARPPAPGLRIPNSVAQAPAAAPAVVAPQAQRYLLGGHGELVPGTSNAVVAPQPPAIRACRGSYRVVVDGRSMYRPSCQ
jgi:hypothetical protein